MTEGWGMSLSLRRMLSHMEPGRLYRVEELWRMSHSDDPRAIVRQALDRAVVERRGTQFTTSQEGRAIAAALRATGEYPVLPLKTDLIRPAPLPLKPGQVRDTEHPQRPKTAPKPSLTLAERAEAGQHPWKYLTAPQLRLLRRLATDPGVLPAQARTAAILVNYGLAEWRNGELVLTDHGRSEYERQLVPPKGRKSAR